MRTETVCYFILTLFVICLTACSGSDNEEENQQLTTPKTQTQPTDEEIIEREEEVIDFAAEEASIRELYMSHAAALSVGDVQEIMEHWVERNTKDVFMVECFAGGIMTRIEKWKNIKASWGGNFALVGRGVVLTVTIIEIGIHENGAEATLRANWKWGGSSGKMVAALEKDKKGNWKILAIDWCDKKHIKEIKPQQPQ